MTNLDRPAVVKALQDAHGNVGKAARLLRCSRRTLQNRMRDYGIPQGRAGRPKRKLRYGGKHRIVGAAVVVGMVGALSLAGKLRRG